MYPINDFITPCLVGKRFQTHAIPFETLKNLAVLEDLVIEAAKWEFLKTNSDRQRVPRGFTEGVTLQLTEIREGSTIPVIMLTLMNRTPLIPDEGSYLRYYESGRDAIFATISSADDQSDTHLKSVDVLPVNLLGYFDQLGRDLREGEALVLNPRDETNLARLTKASRRKILLRSDKIQELTEEVTLRGTVPEMDQEKMSIEFQTISGPRIKVDFAQQHLDSLLLAFNRFRENQKILIRGVGRFSRNEKLLGLNMLEYVAMLDDMDPGARLDEFKSLRNGWLDGKGIAPDHKKLDWLAEAFQSNYPDELPLPYLYPTAEGGVQAEWSAGGWEITLDVDFAELQGTWHALEITTEREQEKILDLNEFDSWNWIASEINKLMGGTA